MRHPSIVSIDLGSAYTKIGIRRGWNEKAEVVRGLPVALAGDESYCVPSVVARIERGRTQRWLIGIEAADQSPGNGVQVFRNWKAALFRPKASGSAGRSADEQHHQATVAAVEFLRQLRKSLVEQKSLDLAKVPVRVAVPRLDGATASVDLICEIMERAGWACAKSRPTVYEPEANALGLLSRGRNSTWIPKQLSYQAPTKRTISMQRMLEPGLSTAFRHMHEQYVVLVTDIGAFTTDFGLIVVDTSLRHDNWNDLRVTQQSVELGIRQLDDRVLSVLSPAAREYFDQHPASEWERRKRELYAGRAQRVTASNGGRVIAIGDAEERDAIERVIVGFAKKVMTARQRFCASNSVSVVHEEAVTGGGSAIAPLRSMLVDAISEQKRRVHDLWDPNEPERATAAGVGYMNAREKELRRILNRMLVRSASAIGGASVFFES